MILGILFHNHHWSPPPKKKRFAAGFTLNEPKEIHVLHIEREPGYFEEEAITLEEVYKGLASGHFIPTGPLVLTGVIVHNYKYNDGVGP